MRREKRKKTKGGKIRKIAKGKESRKSRSKERYRDFEGTLVNTLMLIPSGPEGGGSIHKAEIF